ncbi:MAG: sigma-70 family RNA polymerase sigma factor [Bdellovibrionota bacterium]
MLKEGKILRDATLEQEQALVERAKAGDQEARDALVLSVQGYAIKLVSKYPFSVRMDLIHEANEMVLNLISSYDASKGVLFRTYAWNRMRGTLLDFARENARMVVQPKLSKKRRSILKKVEQAIAEIQKDGFHATVDAIVEKTELSNEDVAWALRHPRFNLDVSFGEPFEPRDPHVDIEGSTLSKRMLERFADELPGFLRSLSEQDQFIFREYFLSETPRSLEEIGNEINLSKSWVSRKAKGTKDKFLKFFRARLVDQET